MKKGSREHSTIFGTLGSEPREIRQEKGKVCFGSGIERKTLESDTNGLVSKHARYYMKETLAVGPGTYDISSQTSAMAALMNKPTSKLGTVLGGRKAVRKGAFDTQKATPAPGKYNIPTFPPKVQETCVPFGSKTKRGKEKVSNVPGVGNYNLAHHKTRDAFFTHSFGGKKCLTPAVKMKCGPFNFDTCERCQKHPEGDYWTLEAKDVLKISAKKTKKSEGIYLCRECYDIEKKENKIFAKGQMRDFKKIRDCSKVHFHDGCEAKLFLVSPQEMAKVKEREAYLSMYFS